MKKMVDSSLNNTAVSLNYVEQGALFYYFAIFIKHNNKHSF
jgi:hypothetical protein